MTNKMLEMSDIKLQKNMEQNHLHISVVCVCKTGNVSMQKKVYLALFEKKTCSPLEFPA